MKSKRRNLFLASSAAISLTLSAPALHAGQIWDGGGTNYNWNAPANWDGDTTPNFALPITFEGVTRNSGPGPLHNLAAGLSVGGINFTNDGTTGKTAAFTVNGSTQSITNSITLAGDITTTASSSAISDTMHRSLDVILDGDRTITTDTNHNLRIDGQISETGGSRSITKEGTGQLTIGNNSLTTNRNSFSGGLNINNGVVSLVGSATLGTAAAGSGTINLGATSGSNDAELRLSGTGMNPTNTLVVQTGSSGTKTLANRSSNSVIYKGIITANDDLTILAANGGGRLTVDAAGSSVAIGKTVAFSNTGTGATMINSATWGGLGSLSYTSNSSMGFEVRGDNTYSGGTTLGAMSGIGTLIVLAGSAFDGNGTLFSGAFGTGMLNIGATQMRGTNATSITIGNAVTFTDNATFITATGEKSLLFTGNTSLGSATRTLTVDIGSTVATESLQFSGVISGTDAAAGITKEGAGNLVLSGNNTYTGSTTVSAGTLIVNGSLASSVVDVTGSLAGSGVMASATLSGSGSVNPGNSPGIMTAAATDPTGGLDYNFELTQANVPPAWNLPAASINDVLRLTDATTPFTASLTGANAVSIYLGVTSLNPGDTFTGGFFTDKDADFLASVSSAQFNYFISDFSGLVTYNGFTYTAYTGAMDVSTVQVPVADFATGNVTNGYVTQFTVAIPEPRAALLGAIGLLALLFRRRR